MSALDPLQDLLRRAQRLHPHWTDPEKFFLARSDLVQGIKSLIATGSTTTPSPLPAPAPARPSAPPPAPSPTLPHRISPVSLAQPLTLTLPPARFALLLGLITAPNPRRRQGFQSRFARWLDAVDEVDHTIRLTGADVLWLRKMLINRGKGGWQLRLYRIFIDTHGHFSGLPIRPWPKRNRRSRRGG
jgi:hypothetical protein